MFTIDNSRFCPLDLLFVLFQITHGQGKPTEGEVVEEWHPLLPVEKKLIIYSLVAALILLIVLVWVSYTYFSVGK
jgi:cell division protein FtsL